MPEPIKNILDRIKEWWLKFNRTQHVLFIVGTLVVIVSIIVLANIFGKPGQKKLRECASEAEAVEVRNLLLANTPVINCTVTEDNIIYVSDKDFLEAKLCLGSNNISSAGYSFADATSSSFTDTETVMTEKYIEYMRHKFEEDLESFSQVKNARVNISYKDTSHNVFAEDIDYKITAILTLSAPIEDEQAEAIGKLLATNVGSDNTNSVHVVDNYMNTLYSGSTANGSSTAHTAANKIALQFENAIIDKASDIFKAIGYNDISVAPHLKVDFDDVEIVSHKYHAPEDTEQGLYKNTYEINSQGILADASGVAGSESNDQDTSYDIEDTEGGTSTYSLKQYEWLQDEVITTTQKAQGEVLWDECSLSVIAKKTTVLTEEDAEELGLLEETTWEEYKRANADPVEIEIDDDARTQYMRLLSTGSGIPTTSISFIALQSYDFFDKEETASNTWLILQIVLMVLIAGALLFIILRSMRPVVVEETEPELSVEDMIATTKQNEGIEEIELQEKSETRKAIEKFVDENPESVAVLLRNWLNEGWS